MVMNPISIPCARYIRDIARGKDNPRNLTRDDARTLWAAALGGAITDLELGAVLVAMRVKGESVDEIAGFFDASQAQGMVLQRPAPGAVPVVIPSYNGARNMPNLTPLLATLLAREGVPVLVHGKVGDVDTAPGSVAAGRTTSAEIFTALGFHAARSTAEVTMHMARGEAAFVSIDTLNPALARILGLRRILGVRNSAHSLVKMLQPFAGPALRLSSYTHPEYHRMLSDYYLAHGAADGGGVLLARGTEGEVVANARRAAGVEWFHDGKVELVIAAQTGSSGVMPNLPDSRDAVATARWIQGALSGERPVPEPITQQVATILDILRRMA